MRARGTGMHALVGAYVMDAVSEADRAEFERHLPACEQCREDVRGLREATARLASAAAVQPRPGLREQTLQAASRIRQLSPVIAGQAGRPGRRPSGSLAGWRRFGRPAGTGRLPWLARLAAGTAVVLAVTAVVLGLHMSQMQTSLSAAQRRDNSIAAIMGAHDAVTFTAHVSTGGTATVVMSHRAHALVFITNGLATLPASKTYELWLMGPGGATSAGMLPPGPRGMMVVDRLRAGEHLGLTVEPAGGASRPSMPPVIMMGLGT
jgi:anti-sigma-K factor RskA